MGIENQILKLKANNTKVELNKKNEGFADGIYEQLPKFLQRCCHPFNKSLRERDIVLIT